MMTSSNGNISRVTGPLWGKFTSMSWYHEFYPFLFSVQYTPPAPPPCYCIPDDVTSGECPCCAPYECACGALAPGRCYMCDQMWRCTDYIEGKKGKHYGDVIMRVMASQITSLTIVCPNVYSGADQRKHQSSASLAFVRGIHRWPVNSPHKEPVMRKMFPFDDIIIFTQHCNNTWYKMNAFINTFVGP